MKIYFIRHGKTAGNISGKYIGRTDESLCDEGISEIKGNVYPMVDEIYVSPMRRCLETKKLIFSDQKCTIISDFREMDFGIFEGKNYQELDGSKEYQQWIDSSCEMKIPGGEEKRVFSARCKRAFDEITAKSKAGTAALVVHGGTIMSILSEVCGGSFYDYHVKNGQGYLFNTETNELMKMEYKR